MTRGQANRLPEGDRVKTKELIGTVVGTTKNCVSIQWDGRATPEFFTTGMICGCPLNRSQSRPVEPITPDSNRSLSTFEPVPVRDREFRREKVWRGQRGEGIFGHTDRFQTTETALAHVFGGKPAES
jgi:hypothetical protein